MDSRPPSLLAVASYFLRLGLTGFGGPVALANAMRRDLVDTYGWLTAAEYDEGLAIATACPGPLAYQLGVYCGYVLHGVAGALSAAIAFAAAPFALVVAIAALYVRYGSTWELRALFHGIAPVVIALIIRSCWDLGKKTLRAEPVAFAVATIACALTIAVQKELTVVFLAAGALGVVLFAPKDAAQLAPPPDAADARKNFSPAVLVAQAFQTVPLPDLFWFFFKTGFLVFGSGLVVVPFLKAYVVDQYHWLTDRAFLDAVAVGMITPGPVVITATFVGYLNNRIAGAIAATAGMFAPSVLFVLVGTPILRKYRHAARVRGFVRGVTVAVVGVLVGTSYLVARSSIGDWFGAAVLAGALAALWSKRKVPEQVLIAAGAALGLAVSLL